MHPISEQDLEHHIETRYKLQRAENQVAEIEKKLVSMNTYAWMTLMLLSIVPILLGLYFLIKGLVIIFWGLTAFGLWYTYSDEKIKDNLPERIKTISDMLFSDFDFSILGFKKYILNLIELCLGPDEASEFRNYLKLNKSD